MFKMFYHIFAGVFAHCQMYAANGPVNLSPAKPSAGKASEISFKSSPVSFMFNDPMLFSKFSIFVVPREM